MIFKRRMPFSRERETMTLDAVNSELRGLASSIRTAFAGGLRMMAVFGSLVRGGFNAASSDVNILIVADSLTMDRLKQLNSIISKSGTRLLISPIVLSEQELPRFSEVFPVKVLEIKSCYRILDGDDLLKDLSVGKPHVKFRCRQELQNLVLKMRRVTVLAADDNVVIARRFSALLPLYLSILKAVAYLFGIDPKAADAIGRTLDLLRVDKELVQRLIDVRTRYREKSDVTETDSACTTFLTVLDKTISAVDLLAKG